MLEQQFTGLEQTSRSHLLRRVLKVAKLVYTTTNSGKEFQTETMRICDD